MNYSSRSACIGIPTGGDISLLFSSLTIRVANTMNATTAGVLVYIGILGNSGYG